MRKDGRAIPVSGGFFGEIALLTDRPRTATVTTSSDVRALVITDRAFHRLLRDSPQIQGKIMRTLAERLAADAV